MKQTTLTHSGTVSVQETRDLVNMLAGAEKISVNIPPTATLTDVEHTLEVAILSFKSLTEAAERIKPIIGRILLEVRERRLWKAQYKNFTDFVRVKVGTEMGLGVTNAFEALKIAKAFPSLSESEYRQIGASRLLLASRVTDETKDTYQQTLQLVKTAPSVEALKSLIKDMGQDAQKDRPKPYIIGVRVSQETHAQWIQLLEREGPDREKGEIFAEMLSLYVIKDQLTRKTPATAPTRRRAS